MTESAAGELLISFPKRWESLQAKREQILESYHSANAYDGARIQVGGHSDPTAKRAGKLVEAEEQDALLQEVRRWLAIGPDQTDRLILIGLWRGLGVMTIAQRYRVWDIRQRWQRMAQGLSRFAGGACGEHGDVCACIPMNRRRDWLR